MMTSSAVSNSTTAPCVRIKDDHIAPFLNEFILDKGQIFHPQNMILGAFYLFGMFLSVVLILILTQRIFSTEDAVGLQEKFSLQIPSGRYPS